jgi:uridine kinase
MLLIGIAGGSGSGKTTMVNRIMQQLPEGRAVLVPQDAYYRDNSHIPPVQRAGINFDHPDSVDFDLLVRQLRQLKEGRTVDRPVYSFLTCTRSAETVTLHPADIAILEGILILVHAQLRELMDIMVYVDAPAGERLERIIRRDMEERGRTREEVLRRYGHTVRPMHEQHVEPSKAYADIVVPHGGENQVAIDILATLIRKRLKTKD